MLRGKLVRNLRSTDVARWALSPVAAIGGDTDDTDAMAIAHDLLNRLACGESPTCLTADTIRGWPSSIQMVLKTVTFYQ